jgi:phospholipid/cholesterol/gamma-HCH transport system permease protein
MRRHPFQGPTIAPAADPKPSASLLQGEAGSWALSGTWTLQGFGLTPPQQPQAVATTLDGEQLQALDSAGAWWIQRWLTTETSNADAVTLQHWPAPAQALLEQVQAAAALPLAEPPPSPGRMARLGLSALSLVQQLQDFLRFLGELTLAAVRALRQPRRLPLRATLREIEIGGFDALPIIGLTAFLLGVVVAYQGADQLQHYGANIFVVELVGYAMLREFAPLIAAIIVAGRSGSAYTAQLGSMQVNEEIDALRTLGLDPLQRLVLPKLLALAIALPLLTVFADVCGVLGGMVMARTQLDIGFAEFIERFGRVMQGSALLLGVGKALVFALLIACVGCFQGLRTGGSADSVGRQTTLSVVQASFLVIVVDALFSIAFNMLEL